jgi:hypothetical protein
VPAAEGTPLGACEPPRGVPIGWASFGLRYGHGFGRSLFFLIEIVGENFRLWAIDSWSYNERPETIAIGHAYRSFSAKVIVHRA